MKPAPFKYLAPETVDEAVALLAEHGTDGKALAGGQSLIPMMNMRLARPSVLVDLCRIDELGRLDAGESLAIGATARQAEVLADASVERHSPLVTEALRWVGHPANRTRGTFGGSVANADPAAELPAVLLALDAELVVRGPDGERVVAAEDFFVTYYTTDLDVDEILAEVRIPAPPPGGRRVWAFGEVARRHGDFAMAGVAMTITLAEDGTGASPRIALFGVADAPVRARRAEERLAGTRLGDEEIAREAGELALDQVDFASDAHVSADYRRDATAVLVRRAALDCFETRGE
jgi:aerobic carbon-monoxide dehydrogenase medium subunit